MVKRLWLLGGARLSRPLYLCLTGAGQLLVLAALWYAVNPPLDLVPLMQTPLHVIVTRVVEPWPTLALPW